MGSASLFLAPPERAKAQGSPVTVGVAKLLPGKLMTVNWRRHTVWLMRRSPDMVSTLLRPDPALVDPLSNRPEQLASCKNATRSLNTR